MRVAKVCGVILHYGLLIGIVLSLIAIASSPRSESKESSASAAAEAEKEITNLLNLLGTIAVDARQIDPHAPPEVIADSVEHLQNRIKVGLSRMTD